MGDPTHFSIKGGANPHTRDIFGRKKSVDKELAITQWHNMAKTLTQYGVDVYVVPPDPNWPGMVYPANAGFLSQLDEEIPIQQKTFILSNLLPTRVGEKEHYKVFLTNLGYKTVEISRRFEGEADLFPVGNAYIFSYGRIEEQRFVLRFGFPPWKRIYGFRTDREVLTELKPYLGNRSIIEQVLINEAHYHGDTVFCALGPNKEYLLVYMEGLSPDSQERLKNRLRDQIIPLAQEDAWRYASNSFQTIVEGTPYLFVPSGLSRRLLDRIRERGVHPVEVDVSEFMKKGGGSVKCMIGDLGWVVDDPAQLPSAQKEFRKKHLYQNLFS